GGAVRKPGVAGRRCRLPGRRAADHVDGAGDLVERPAGLPAGVRRDRGARHGAVQRRPIGDLRGPARARHRALRGRRRTGDRDRGRQGRRRRVLRGRGRAGLPRSRWRAGRRLAGRAGGCGHPAERAGRCRGVRRARLDRRHPRHRPVARLARRTDGRGRWHGGGELTHPPGAGGADPRHPVPLHPAGDRRLSALPRDRRERRRCTGHRL
ncbi:MAG: EpiH/GdmH-related protein, partial [uncultured Blastococcus sp.]